MPKSQPLDMWEQFDPEAELPPSSLHDYFKKSSNSVSRERIFTHRLLSDLKVGAAMSNYHLQTYQPDVDRDGHDVVLEDDMRTFNLQLKTVYGKKRHWDIRKRLLRPEGRYAKAFQIENAERTPDSELQKDEGLQGGVVVIEPSIHDGALKEITYFYTDIFIVFAICAGLVPGKNPDKTTLASRVKAALQTGSGSGSVNVDRTCLVQARDAEGLLALAGLCSRYSSSWRLNVPRYLSTAVEDRLPQDKTDALSQYAREIRGNLEQLIR